MEILLREERIPMIATLIEGVSGGPLTAAACATQCLAAGFIGPISYAICLAFCAATGAMPLP